MILPVENDGFFFSASICDVHVRDSKAVSWRAVGVQENFHLEESSRLDVQIGADQLAVLADGNAQNRFGRPSFDHRDVILSFFYLILKLNSIFITCYFKID